jgi:cyanophycinase
MAATYRDVFGELGVRGLDVVDIRSREDAHEDAMAAKIRDASVVFFTGGDQLRITSQVGDSPVFRCLLDIYRRGATIAGTSAGAAAMSETMLVSGPGDESHQISALGMAPGLGLISGVVVDSHFAERGRFGRLLGAVAQNPKNIGIGIDEDTAIVVEHDERFRVLGSGAVYVFDGTEVSYSSLSERRPEGILTIHDVRLHVLGEGDCYDLTRRRPVLPDERSEVAG